MNIPEKLKIGGFDWEVIIDKERTDYDENHGFTQSRRQKIYLSPDDTRQKQEQTLIHELMHAVWWQAGLNVRDDLKKFDEEVIAALSFGVYQVLKDNGMLS